MDSWQTDLLASLADGHPFIDVRPYGSVLEPTQLDGWSDLDVAISCREAFDIEAAFQGEVWAYQSTIEDGIHIVRVVLADGRRIDARISGASGMLPAPSTDNDVRFNAALAAVRFGRGSHLIGVHLALDVIRDALVQRMVAADLAEQTSHHRGGTTFDADAARALSVLEGPLGPQIAFDAYALYGEWRSAVEAAYAANSIGLQAVIDRGRSGEQPSGQLI